MWPDASETQQLLDAARRGDADARGQLLARHRDALRRLVGLRIDPALGRRVDASDIVQDVLLDADRRLVDYLASDGMPFHLWLRCLARDRLIDAHRHHRRAQRRSLDREQPLLQMAWSDQSAIDLADLVRDRQATPAAAAMGRELELRFQAALDQLDDTDREIVLLRHFEQLTNGETAEVLGLSAPAAGMRYLRAMRRLRTLLDEVPSEERRQAKG
ncbi:MAG TPA: sigma-70 family RNA polymerase sigma factor [Pirellulales bacterium]|jgi:RNA polymerase sigma-70 factor (ECF subfamily)|nr:sigma-70 family RNA polymerase sigma factor [Pirellulales bacterium]